MTPESKKSKSQKTKKLTKRKLSVNISKALKTFLTLSQPKFSLIEPKKTENDLKKQNKNKVKKSENEKAFKRKLSVNISKALKTFRTPSQAQSWPDRAKKRWVITSKKRKLK